MIERLLPAGVASAERFEDPPDLVLLEEERGLVEHAVPARQREVITTRHCARLAMAQLGVAPVPILADERRAPRWPVGVVGSMTHCTGYRAAAVALASQVRSLGIDAEPHDALPAGVLARVSLEDERAWVHAASAAATGVHRDRLLFSAKEAVFKAWFPLTGRWLGFQDAQLAFEEDDDDGRAGSFTARLLVDGHTHAGEPLSVLRGRWLVDAGLVLSTTLVT